MFKNLRPLRYHGFFFFFCSHSGVLLLQSRQDERELDRVRRHVLGAQRTAHRTYGVLVLLGDAHLPIIFNIHQLHRTGAIRVRDRHVSESNPCTHLTPSMYRDVVNYLIISI